MCCSKAPNSLANLDQPSRHAELPAHVLTACIMTLLILIANIVSCTLFICSWVFNLHLLPLLLSCHYLYHLDHQHLLQPVFNSYLFLS